MTACDHLLFLFFKGNENYRTEGGGSESLRSRKRNHSWKTPVSAELYHQRAYGS